MNNGRVDTTKDNNFNMYALFQNGNNKLSEFSHEAIQGVHIKTPLNDLFFSKVNIDALQLGIRNLIANKTNNEFVVGNQSEVELQIIMRAIYLSDAKHLSYDIIGQVKTLNEKVLDYCVPRILEEIKMFNYYKNDVSKLPMPLDRGQFSSSKGTRFLEQREF
jgi:Family of unknown function (DUF5761)